MLSGNEKYNDGVDKNTNIGLSLLLSISLLYKFITSSTILSIVFGEYQY